jgi:hypothetical protein
MTVRELLLVLLDQPMDAHIMVWDPTEEVAGEILRVKDIHQPTDEKETYIIAEFG